MTRKTRKLTCRPHYPTAPASRRSSVGSVARRVRHARLGESLFSQQATVASSAGTPFIVRIVTTERHPIIHAQFQPPADDLGLAQMNQRHMDFKCPAARGCHARRKVGHLLECHDIFPPTIRISAVIHRVHADEHVPYPQHFRPRQCVAQKDRVPCRHVGDRNPLGHLRLPTILRHVDGIGECAFPKLPQVDPNDPVFRRPHRLGHRRRRFQFKPMPLAVVERQRINRPKSVGPRDSQARRAVESPAA